MMISYCVLKTGVEVGEAAEAPNVEASCVSIRDISGRCGKTLNKKGKSKSKRLKAAIVPQNCTLSAAHPPQPPAFNLVSPYMISCSHITHQQSIQSAQRVCVCVATEQWGKEKGKRKDERKRIGRASDGENSRRKDHGRCTPPSACPVSVSEDEPRATPERLLRWCMGIM